MKHTISVNDQDLTPSAVVAMLKDNEDPPGVDQPQEQVQISSKHPLFDDVGPWLALFVLLPTLLKKAAERSTIPVIPLLVGKELGGDDGDIGLVMSCVGLGKLMGNIPSGQYVGAFGSYPGLTCSCLVLSAAWLLAAAAPSVALMVVSSLMEGLGMAMWQIARQNLITSSFNVDQGRGKVMATISGLERFSSVLGPSLGGYLSTSIGVRAPFYVKSALAMSDAGLFWILQWIDSSSSSFFPARLRRTSSFRSKQDQPASIGETTRLMLNPDSEISHSFTTQDSGVTPSHDQLATPNGVHNGETNTALTTTSATPTFCSNVKATLLRHGRDLRITSVWLMLFPIARDTRLLLFPLKAIELGYDADSIGVMTSITFAVDSMMFPLSGYIMDEYGRKAVCVPSCLLLALSYALGPWANNMLPLTLISALGGMGNGISGGALSSIGSDLAPKNKSNTDSKKAGERERAMFLAIFRTVSDVGVFIGPLVGGGVADRLSITDGFYTIASMTFLAAMWVAFCVPETRWTR